MKEGVFKEFTSLPSRAAPGEVEVQLKCELREVFVLLVEIVVRVNLRV